MTQHCSSVLEKIGTHCKGNEMLVSSVHYNKTQMYYKKSCDDDNYDDENEKLMRVKLTFTFNAEVKVFNQYVTASGLTERELPSNEYPSGIIGVPIPGLSIEKYRDPTFQNNGYVIF